MLLYNIIAWITTSCMDNFEKSSMRGVLSPKEHKMVLNIAQDLMYNVTGAPMPKHVLRQTRSKNLVTILNRFGHSISYGDAQRYVAAIAHQIDAQMDDNNSVVIPANLAKGEFVQCAYDNLDFVKDSKDGKTSHSTTHIMYQYPSANLDCNTVESFLTSNRKQQITSVNFIHLRVACRSKIYITYTG